MPELYGAVVNLHTGQEFDWCGEDQLEVIHEQLRTFKGCYVYGQDWKFAADLSMEGSDILVRNKAEGYLQLFAGEQALEAFAKYIEEQ